MVDWAGTCCVEFQMESSTARCPFGGRRHVHESHPSRQVQMKLSLTWKTLKRSISILPFSIFWKRTWRIPMLKKTTKLESPKVLSPNKARAIYESMSTRLDMPLDPPSDLYSSPELPTEGCPRSTSTRALSRWLAKMETEQHTSWPLEWDGQQRASKWLNPFSQPPVSLVGR